MNWLICSVGRRNYIVEYFKKELNQQCKKVYATDESKYAPALYVADDYFIMNCKEFYIDNLIKKCKELNISNIVSLHDEQIWELATYKARFDRARINLMLSDYEIIELCYDKLRYKELSINQIPTCIVKDRNGSASSGLQKVRQPFLDGTEYNIQCYFDFISGRLIDIFMQEKISMRAGETDKSISIWDDEIYMEIEKLDCDIGFKGVVDIDVIKADRVYIMDINPRFGGGYPLAHYCGKNYVKCLINNANKEIDTYGISRYQLGVAMMKYSGLYFKE